MTNISTDLINQTRALLDQSQGALIVLAKNPSLDEVASGISLYLALSSRGKRATIVSPDSMTVEFSHLVGVDKITNSLGSISNGNNLVISFPYQEGSIEKVSYNIENDTFNLVIEPREGYPTVTSEMIRFSSSGGEVDVIFSIGAQNFSDLDNIYQNNTALFADKPVINIDVNRDNQRFGKINLVDPTASSISELLITLFSSWGINIDADLASNLFAGIVSGSNNFTSNTTTAATFENAAICLKYGAKRGESETFSPKLPSFPQHPPKMPPTISPKPVRPPQINIKQPLQPQPQQHPSPILQKQSTSEAPPDWLKPKIYKGSTLL